MKEKHKIWWKGLLTICLPQGRLVMHSNCVASIYMKNVLISQERMDEIEFKEFLNKNIMVCKNSQRWKKGD